MIPYPNSTFPGYSAGGTTQSTDWGRAPWWAQHTTTTFTQPVTAQPMADPMAISKAFHEVWQRLDRSERELKTVYRLLEVMANNRDLTLEEARDVMNVQDKINAANKTKEGVRD